MALEYARAGYPVFPLIPHDKAPLKGSHGVYDATTDERQIIEWWEEELEANIAIPTGAISRSRHRRCRQCRRLR